MKRINLKQLKNKIYFSFFGCSLNCAKCCCGEIRFDKKGNKREYCTRKNIWGDKKN